MIKKGQPELPEGFLIGGIPADFLQIQICGICENVVGKRFVHRDRLMCGVIDHKVLGGQTVGEMLCQIGKDVVLRMDRGKENAVLKLGEAQKFEMMAGFAVGRPAELKNPVDTRFA